MGKGKYTLDHLMRVRGETEFLGDKIYLRTLGARQDELRMQHAMAWAREFRNRLRDKGSEEYQLYIAPLVVSDIEELRQLAIGFERIRLNRESTQVIVPEREPRLDEDATLTDAMDVEEEEEKIEEDTVSRRAKWVEEQLEIFVREKLDGYESEDGSIVEPEWSEHDLRKHVMDAQVEQLAQKAYVERFNDMTLLFGCFADSKCRRPYFKSLEEIQECAPILKAHLLNAYFDLDVFSADLDELKNLRRGQ